MKPEHKTYHLQDGQGVVFTEGTIVRMMHLTEKHGRWVFTGYGTNGAGKGVVQYGASAALSRGGLSKGYSLTLTQNRHTWPSFH
jgi:hypothetical protein